MRGGTISVIIPTYNCGKYVAEAVESVLSQSIQAAEIIVVDDGSTDGTAGALKPYQGRVRYLYQENRGEPAARNLGIRNSTGEFLAWLDADDLWLPGKLELQMAYFARHPQYALVYTDCMSFDDNGVIDRSIRERFNLVFPQGNIYPALFRETIFGSGSVIFRRNCLEKAGWFDEELLIGSDYDMWLRIARHFEVGYIDQPLLMYRQHATMSTRRVRCLAPDGDPWEVSVVKKSLRLYPETRQKIGHAAIDERLSKAYAGAAQGRFQEGDYRFARRLFRKALRHAPRNRQYWLFYLLSFLPPSQVAAARTTYRKLRGLAGASGRTAQSDAQAGSQP